MKISVMNKKILILFCLIIGIVVSLITYQLLPRYHTGQIDNIKELNSQFILCHMLEFNTAGKLNYVEQRQFTTRYIVVWGKCQTAPPIFENNSRKINIYTTTMPDNIFIADYGYDFTSKKSSIPARKVSNKNTGYNYKLLNDRNEIVNEMIHIDGYVESTYFSMYIDPNSKNFILNIQLSR